MDANLKSNIGLDNADHPLVSIIIPVYNGANYLREAIESALQQTYRNVEVLVVNDGSNDGGATERIARSFGHRVRYFFKPNGGVATALNFGIREMRGEYFSWLSHDDLYYSHKVQSQIDFLRSLGWPKDAIPFSDFIYIDHTGRYLSTKLFEAVPPLQFRYFLLADPGLHGCSLLIPRIAFIQCGFFPEDEPYTQDYSLWLKLSERYCFVHQDAILIKSRNHVCQDSKCVENDKELRKFKRREVERFFGSGIADAFPGDVALQRQKKIELVESLERQAPGIVDHVVLEGLGLSRRFLMVRYFRSLLKSCLPSLLTPGCEVLSAEMSESHSRLFCIGLMIRAILPQCIGRLRLRS